ncbi:MAG: DUF3570 domain-containing protein [Chitinophagales bacterium]
MRLSLIFIYTCLLSCLGHALLAQENISAKQREQIDLSFLFGYYTQEGNHSAVTGGEGTEKLSDYDSRIIVHIPLDSNQSLGAHVGINHYTSASSDKIDSRISSASSDDTRSTIELSYQKNKPEKNSSISLYSGGAVETDYISSSFGGGWDKSSESENSFYGFDFRAYFDTWNIILPEELRATDYGNIKTDKRRTFNLSNYFSQVLNKRSQIHLTLDFIAQQGLLSTPFHRVYFTEIPGTRIEQLPSFRIKIPLSLRWNHRLLEKLILRNWARVYWDNWGIASFTWEFESPVLLPKGWSLSPLYRFHIQSAAKYFAPKSKHTISSTYYTSDFDLSNLNSHRFGLALRYALPLRLSKGKFTLSRFEIRAMRYLRSDGLHAYLAAFSIACKI